MNGEETGNNLGNLDKTIKAFDIIHNKLKLKYDFIVRTTVASYVNFSNVYKYLNSLNNNNSYYIGPFFKLNWIDIPNGIVDKRYWETNYCSGTCIIMNYKLIENIIDDKEQLDYSVCDDVSFGVYIKKLTRITYIDTIKLHSFVSYNSNINSNNLIHMNNFNKENRNIDINNLKELMLKSINTLQCNNCKPLYIRPKLGLLYKL